MENSNLFVVALDGPAGSGKSTIATMLAKELGCIHADSGAMYRTLTLAAMQRLGEQDSPQKFGEMFKNQNGFRAADSGVSVGLGANGQQLNLIHENDIGNQIRTPAVTARIRYIADDRNFRDYVNELLGKLASQTSIVADGRDMGSVVFKNTPWKFFLDASVEIRAQRRMLEMQEKNLHDGISMDELKQTIQARDDQDRNREFGALVQAPDSILIDTSSMSRNDVVHTLLVQLQKKF